VVVIDNDGLEDGDGLADVDGRDGIVVGGGGSMEVRFRSLKWRE